MPNDPFFGISTAAVEYVRTRAESIMGYTCRIERVKKSSFNQETGTAVPGGKTTIYEGPCRVFEVQSGAPMIISEEDVVMQTTQLSIPWDVDPVPIRDDEVQILSADDDQYMVGKRFVIDSSAKAGELRATRRFMIRGYQK